MKTNSFIAAALCVGGLVAGGSALATGSAPAWVVPDINKLPNDTEGRVVRYGKELMDKTSKYLGPEAADPAKRYAGNNLACSSCHVEAGTQKFANPFVGTFADFPSYRPREHAVGTIEDRINGCMERSMAGKRLPADNPELRAMAAYMKFMSTGVPVGAQVEGRGTPKIALIERAADPVKGESVYQQYCVACHGADGQGVRAGKVGDGLGYTFPPLWGSDSYNTGAGMHRVILAARFIKYNMPKGTTHENPLLTDEQAFDVAAYINSKPRPQKANLEADFPARANKPVDAAFPPYREGFSAEQHKYGPFKPIVAARNKAMEEMANKAKEEAARNK